jgi:DNA helicase-2/ATP-dependent DNA helicase PcrA
MKCKDCGAEMLLRSRKSDDALFWGCSNYPACKGITRYVEEEILEAVESAFRPTPEQQAVFDHMQNKKNLIIQAVAGSGKTTTVLQCMKYVPEEASAIFLAFNKAIADTLGNRAPAHVDVRTLHSLGLSFIRNNYPKITVDGNKVDDILAEVLEKYQLRHKYTLSKLHSLLMSNDLPCTRKSVEDLIDYYGMEVDEDDVDFLIKTLQKLHKACRASFNMGLVDYDEMVYYPTIMPGMVKTYDYVFVDECQDLNPIQIKFIHLLVGRYTKVVCVGDRQQSIYGFRGADIRAMDELQNALQADELPLSVCFRCPTSHIDLASKIVPQIQARDGAPEGVVVKLKLFSMLGMVAKQDLVLCRLNAPLLKVAFQLIRQGKPAHVRGRDIGEAIISLLSTAKDKPVDEAIEYLTSRCNKKAQKLVEQNKDSAANYLMDICDCAVSFLLETGDISSAKAAVNEIFKDTANSIELSSVHKAKGLEATNVYILDFQSMPMRVKQNWEKVQEQNIIYVALTRSKSYLAMVEQ